MFNLPKFVPFNDIEILGLLFLAIYILILNI